MTGFASTKDLADKTITFAEIGPGLYAFTAEGDPNTGVVIGDDGVLIVDAQATPAMAQAVIERVYAPSPTSRSRTCCSRIIMPCGCWARPPMAMRR